MIANRAIFTVVTKSYLAHARVMAKELHARHPEIPFYVFLVDRPDGFFSPNDEPFHVVQIGQILPVHLLSTMTGYYTAYELSGAIRPFAHLYMSQLQTINSWLYFDADIYMVGNLESLFNQLKDTSLLLLPHIIRVDVIPQVQQLELSFLRTGVYNSGIVGVINSVNALQFLHWWKERLIWYSLHYSPGLEADQSWLNFVPSLFPDYKLVRDPGVNVAYWNIHERKLVKNAAGGFSVSDHLVSTIHFSGWDWRNPDRLTKHPNVDLSLFDDAWLQALRDFAERLRTCGVESCSQWPYSFAKAKNGHILTPVMRRNYWTRLHGKDENTVIPSIFDKPEMFEDPKKPEPKKLSLWTATRIWLGVVKRHLLSVRKRVRGSF